MQKELAGAGFCCSLRCTFHVVFPFLVSF